MDGDYHWTFVDSDIGVGKEVSRTSSTPSYCGRNRRAQGSSYWLVQFINYFGVQGQSNATKELGGEGPSF
jgi:hypothetical protein